LCGGDRGEYQGSISATRPRPNGGDECVWIRLMLTPYYAKDEGKKEHFLSAIHFWESSVRKILPIVSQLSHFFMYVVLLPVFMCIIPDRKSFEVKTIQ